MHACCTSDILETNDILTDFWRVVSVKKSQCEAERDATHAFVVNSEDFVDLLPKPSETKVAHENEGQHALQQIIATKNTDLKSGIALNGWIIGSNKSHISNAQVIDIISEKCRLNAPPEMCFGKNVLMFFHEKSKVCVEFMVTDALHQTHFGAENKNHVQLKVPAAKNRSKPVNIMAHADARAMDSDVKELELPYDWTFTTRYKGTISHQKLMIPLRDYNLMDEFYYRGESHSAVETEEKINYAKLKEREPILWSDEVNLFEDELHDSGTSVMSVKVRVMPSGFFCLSRFWMRLDNVVIRVHETRMHHLFNTNYILREYTEKESTIESLARAGHPSAMEYYTDVNTFHHLIATKKTVYEKVILK